MAREGACLYRIGVDLGYIGRFGRWMSSTFAIRLHFDGEISRNLSPGLMRCAGLTSHLRVCDEGTRNAAFEQRGDVVAILCRKLGGGDGVGPPTSLPQEKRVGSNDRTRPPVEEVGQRKIKKGPPPNGPRVEIDAAIMWGMAREERFRDIASWPEYSFGDDGSDASMGEASLYYVTHGKDFVDGDYQSINFRHSEIRSRDLRSARAASRETPSCKTTLQAYQMAYRRYINRRHQDRRDEEILEEKMDQS